MPSKAHEMDNTRKPFSYRFIYFFENYGFQADRSPDERYFTTCGLIKLPPMAMVPQSEKVKSLM